MLMLTVATDLDTASVGRLGELVVEAELLARGWQAGNFNATTGNSAGWDIFAARPGRSLKVRVKAKKPGVSAFRWSARADGSVLKGLSGEDADDVVAAVSFHSAGGYSIFLIPAFSVETELRRNHAAYLAEPGRNGAARKDSAMRMIHIDQRSAIGHGYADKWAVYRDNWHALSGG
ncbi:hypothetical protein [Maricaulis sp.]|uniref:hypothetical protein n=1 Tax=Maricaulis sp. TaxID=1486257 RepID=UPI003A8F2024